MSRNQLGSTDSSVTKAIESPTLLIPPIKHTIHSVSRPLLLAHPHSGSQEGPDRLRGLQVDPPGHRRPEMATGRAATAAIRWR